MICEINSAAHKYSELIAFAYATPNKPRAIELVRKRKPRTSNDLLITRNTKQHAQIKHQAKYMGVIRIKYAGTSENSTAITANPYLAITLFIFIS